MLLLVASDLLAVSVLLVIAAFVLLVGFSLRELFQQENVQV